MERGQAWLGLRKNSNVVWFYSLQYRNARWIDRTACQSRISSAGFAFPALLGRRNAMEKSTEKKELDSAMIFV
jgi:hypothetical protein